MHTESAVRYSHWLKNLTLKLEIISMDSFSTLLRASKLAQVATPISKLIRGGSQQIPTHQVIYTPKAAAVRSEFGIKTTLPKQIGYSHISFNNIDNKTGMPDVEKNTSKMYLRIRLQENNIIPKVDNKLVNPLFRRPDQTTDHKNESDSLLLGFNLHPRASVSQVKQILKANPKLHSQFQKWLAEEHPQVYLAKNNADHVRLVSQFLRENPNIVKHNMELQQLRKDLNGRTSVSANAKQIQGTAGLSYAQPGRLSNTPNGIKYHTVVPGRLVENNTIAISGFTGGVLERQVQKPALYASNVPGHHSRQFTMPFKVTLASMWDNGSVSLNVEYVKVGDWVSSHLARSTGQKRFEPLNPMFDSVAGRHTSKEDPLARLLNVVNN